MKKFIMSVCVLLVIFGIHTKAEDSEGGRVSNNQNSADILAEADQLFKKNDLNEALTKYEAALAQAISEFNRSVETEALAQIARSMLKLNRKDEGRGKLAEAGKRAEETDKMGYSRYLGVKGRFEWQDNDLPAARETFSAMYDYCQANQLWGRMIDACNLMSIVVETPKDQIDWINKGIDAAESSDNEAMLAVLYNNLGATFYDGKNYEQALEAYKKSREYHWRFSGETAKLFADYHVGMTLRLLGKYEDAGQWLRPVLAWAERLGHNSATGQACEDLGEIALIAGEKETAKKYFNRARDEYQKAGFDKSWPEIWENINSRLEAVGK